MKKVFVITLNGLADKFIVAADQQEAFDRRAEVDPSFDFLPVEVKELEIEGYDIHATEKQAKKEKIPADPPKPEVNLQKPKQTSKKQSKK